MAFRRRRRRFNGVWYPCITPGETLTLVIPFDVALSWNTDPVTGDRPIGGIELTNSDLTGSGFYDQAIVRQGYQIKRLVGKFHASYTQAGSESGIITARLFAGLFIDRVNKDGVPVLEGTADNPWDVTQPLNTQKRWLWRRSWMLSNPIYKSAGLFQVNQDYPSTTAGYGSVLDGPHIDVKPNAHVGLTERLFLYTQARGTWFNEAEGTSDSFQYSLDLRMLAKPTSSYSKLR